MFQDREEQERLTTELEQQEAFAEDSKEVAVYNTDATDVTPEELSEALLAAESPKIPSLKGYWIAALILTLGIVGIVIYWLILGGIV